MWRRRVQRLGRGASLRDGAGTWRRPKVVSRRTPRCPRCNARRSERTMRSGNLAGFSPEKVHEDELTESHRVGEIGLSTADGGDALHELDEGPVAGEHEGVDHDAAAAAVGHFAERLRRDE